MKLTLEHNKGISVLHVKEDVDIHSVKVLNAGVTNLLKSGKNRIILNMIDVKKLPVEALVEALSLHKLASELGGSIYMVGQGDKIKEALKSIPNPPAVKYFSTPEAALVAFQEELKNEKAATSNASEDELKKIYEKLKAENSLLKSKTQGRNNASLKQLQKDNKQLQVKIKILEDQVALLTKEKKKPYELESIQSKIKELEKVITETLAGQGLMKKA